ncbi:MAG: Uma2 family endonuclease [Polyangiales bacterium]
MRSSASVALVPDDLPPEHWHLADGFKTPISVDTQEREDAVQHTFEARVAADGLDVSVLANVAPRWNRSQPTVGVDPDVMWVEPRLPKGLRSVLTWEPGVKPPRVAVEIVGRETAHKDYNHGPSKYAASGTRELWVFDPDGFGRTDTGEGPWVLQVWRRQRGRFVRVYAGDGPARTEALDAWLVVKGGLLRVADDREGQRLWPTLGEARAAAEERAASEAAVRVAADARADAADARVRELEALLAKLRGE